MGATILDRGSSHVGQLPKGMRIEHWCPWGGGGGVQHVRIITSKVGATMPLSPFLGWGCLVKSLAEVNTLGKVLLQGE